VQRNRLQIALISFCFLAGITTIAASLAIPILFLLHLSNEQLNRWSEIGQALSPLGIFFSGVGFIGVAVALLIQQREVKNQSAEISIAQEEQARSSEVVMRRLHTDLVKMAIEDPELLSVWPDIAPGVAESKKDHYCNLILNLQKVAYETHTIELAELRGALRYLMTSRDIYLFWQKTRQAHLQITSGDESEDFFTAEVDRAFSESKPPPEQRPSILKSSLTRWRHHSNPGRP
jgi:hypothetical protein